MNHNNYEPYFASGSTEYSSTMFDIGFSIEKILRV